MGLTHSPARRLQASSRRSSLPDSSPTKLIALRQLRGFSKAYDHLAFQLASLAFERAAIPARLAQLLAQVYKWRVIKWKGAASDLSACPGGLLAGCPMAVSAPRVVTYHREQGLKSWPWSSKFFCVDDVALEAVVTLAEQQESFLRMVRFALGVAKNAWPPGG